MHNVILHTVEIWDIELQITFLPLPSQWSLNVYSSYFLSTYIPYLLVTVFDLFR